MAQDYMTGEELALTFKFALPKEAAVVLNKFFCYAASYLRKEQH
jgi:hypothetical protein